MIIVDSSVWIDHFNGRRTREVDLFHDLLGRCELGLSDLILCEVLGGFRSERCVRRAGQALEPFPVFDMVGYALAARAAQNERRLRERGVARVAQIPLLIATFVTARGFRLLHADRRFDPLEHELGLDVVRASPPRPPAARARRPGASPSPAP